jgi:arsenate reductase (thioredoxin)
MKILVSAVATLAVACSTPVSADDAAAGQIVFVCEHGKVKSLMAAAYFNQLATQRGLPWRAVSRGSAPDSTTVPVPIAALLRAEGVDVSDFRPAKIDGTDIAGAARIVAIGTDLPEDVHADPVRIEHWNDVPAVSTSYEAARVSLKAHIAELLERLSRQSAGRQADRSD